MEKIKLGLVGVQSQIVGKYFLEACKYFPSELEIASAADISPLDAARPTLERFSIPPNRYWQIQGNYDIGYELDDAFFQNIDAVYVALINRAHEPLVMLAASHGKHVIVEKPPSHSVESTELLIEWIKRYRVKGMVTFHKYHLGVSLKLQELIHSELLESLRIQRMYAVLLETDKMEHPRNQWLFFRPELSGGGVGIDIGGHPLSIVYGQLVAETADILHSEYDSCLPPDEGFGQIGNQYRQAETSFDLIIRPIGGLFDKGALAKIWLAKALPEWLKRQGIWLFGEIGGEPATVVMEWPEQLSILCNGSIQYNFTDSSNPYCHIIRGFLDYIKGKKEIIADTLEIGRKCMRTIFDAYGVCEAVDFYREVHSVNPSEGESIDWLNLNEDDMRNLPPWWPALLPRTP